MISFETWIKYHINEQTPYGDLARDYIDAIKINKEQGKKKPKLDKDHLLNYRACAESFETLKKAKKSYKEFISLKKNNVIKIRPDLTPNELHENFIESIFCLERAVILMDDLSRKIDLLNLHGFFDEITDKTDKILKECVNRKRIIS